MPKPLSFFIAIIIIMVGCTSKENKEGFYFKNLSASQTGIDFENTIIESDSLNLLVPEYAYMGGGGGPK